MRDPRGTPAETPIIVAIRELDGDPPAPFAIVLVSPGEYPGLCYTYPAKVVRTGKRLRLEVQPVKLTTTGPCPAAIGPATATVAFPRDLDGTYRLEIAHRGASDVFELRVSARDIVLVPPERTRVTAPVEPLAQLRVPPGAVHVECHASADERCALPDGGAPSCSAVVGDPALADLPGARLESGHYTREPFNRPGGCYVDVGGLERLGELARHLGARFRPHYSVGAAGMRCLQITLDTWRGDHWVNPPP